MLRIRHTLRRRDSIPLLVAFFGDRLAEQSLHVLPRSPIGQAIVYAGANWAALCRYPEQGAQALLGEVRYTLAV